MDADSTDAAYTATAPHKVDSNCSGVRNKTAYVAKDDYNENTMMSDYCFLEEAFRIADNALRTNSQIQEALHKKGRSKLELLRNHLKRHHIRYIYTPGLKRHDVNTTHLLQRAKFVMWTIELNFVDAEACLLLHKIRGSSTWRAVLDKVLLGNGTMKHRLRAYEGMDSSSLHVYSIAEGSGKQKRMYHKVDLTQSLQDHLVGKTVVEYPQFEVRIEPLASNVVVSESAIRSIDDVDDNEDASASDCDNTPSDRLSAQPEPTQSLSNTEAFLLPLSIDDTIDGEEMLRVAAREVAAAAGSHLGN
ncbi:hypothetical protein SeLEV6574_g04367 [Synchytrium endobioticum]|uniref:BCD1 alpha/beta domain-containing protein n=1 Tax=Synchytrium endobioticum TaxID=286115 RepID=A0A507CZP7_9FUNG|nr:hypothetical protein SeLEV6574_g04367 [Synchytrium endobioticum]